LIKKINGCAYPQQVPQYANDEIDLFELFESLWREKLLIVAITVLIVMI